MTDAELQKVSYFPIRGIVEGFYGTFYTFQERLDMIRFLGDNGFNFYMYGPKNDRQHRARWWDQYPQHVLDEFEECLAIAEEVDVTFCYAISFTVPLTQVSDEVFAIVTDKFKALYDRGCRAFGVLLDDITDASGNEAHQSNVRQHAEAHSSMCNRLLDWAKKLDPDCSLYLCPAEYHGTPPFSEYTAELGRRLEPDIRVFYTGVSVCSREITLNDVHNFSGVLEREPVIWDNYPTNDLLMRPELHIGPLIGRGPRLYEGCAGFISNVMNQPEASKIPLLTIAEYLRDPVSYDAGAAWERALLRLAGQDGLGPLMMFAENSLASCLREEQAPHMTRLGSATLDALKRGEPVADSAAVAMLSNYLDVLDESCYYLKNRLRNVALRQEILPWIEALEDRLWMVRRALQMLNDLQQGADFERSLRTVEESLSAVQRSAKSVGGGLPQSIARYARKRGREALAEPQTAQEAPAYQPPAGKSVMGPASHLPAAGAAGAELREESRG